jgi:RHH-type transcriptional regulator, proline utilization regulon repressor / proline dehydrogenase / delta 1-pyrroline-5-carboxylate dehydrogenase
MTTSPSLEPAILRIGEQLAQLSAGLSPSIFDGRWWSHSAINLAMKDASFKTRLFHFIDVLPVIQDDERVVRTSVGIEGPGLNKRRCPPHR